MSRVRKIRLQPARQRDLRRQLMLAMAAGAQDIYNPADPMCRRILADKWNLYPVTVDDTLKHSLDDFPNRVVTVDIDVLGSFDVALKAAKTAVANYLVDNFDRQSHAREKFGLTPSAICRLVKHAD